MLVSAMLGRWLLPMGTILVAVALLVIAALLVATFLVDGTYHVLPKQYPEFYPPAGI